MPYNVFIAYFLWLISGFGVMGFHRFYLRKIPTGLIWFFTGGACFVGAVYDFFTLGNQVKQANYLAQAEAFRANPALQSQPAAKPDSLEKVILKTAHQNAGHVTPSEAALTGTYSMAEVQKELDRLAAKGFCELRIAKGGSTFYYFPEFDAEGKHQDSL